MLGITMGDPAGIGPEIILKAYTNQEVTKIPSIVIGSYQLMKKVQTQIFADDPKINNIILHKVTEKDLISSDSESLKNLFDLLPDSDNVILPILDIETKLEVDKLRPGKVQEMAGDAAFKYVHRAIQLANNNLIDGVVTGPLNKEALQAAGYDYPGHTEIFAKFTETKDYAMMLHDEKLSVIHVSTHIGLLDAIENLDKDRIKRVIELSHSSLRQMGYQKPNIAVAGLNPHAGEGGLFGREELDVINLAIEEIKSQTDINVSGPHPPDTVFYRALKGNYDIVVVMYHDQGHIPLKLLGFHSGVNVTVGLPIVRTSVDHGTHFKGAWKGIARPDSMIEAIKLAQEFQN